MLRFLLPILLLLPRLLLAEELPTPHADLPVQPRLQVPPQAIPPRDPPRDAALQQVENRLACACFVQGQLKIDRQKPATAAACPCDFAQKMRADLEQSLASVPTDQLQHKQTVAETLEANFVPIQPEYEQVFRYDPAQFDWFMHNVRCVCEGCKPTIFFYKCGLTCTPGILYKLRAKVFLALGYTTTELLDYYLAEVNAQKPPGERLQRENLLPQRQREEGWLVPALGIGGTALVLLFLLSQWSKKPARSKHPLIPQENPPEPLSEQAKVRLQEALDEDPDW